MRISSTAFDFVTCFGNRRSGPYIILCQRRRRQHATANVGVRKVLSCGAGGTESPASARYSGKRYNADGWSVQFARILQIGRTALMLWRAKDTKMRGGQEVQVMREREETDDFCISFRIPSYQTIILQLQWLLRHHIFEPSFPCLGKLNGRERRNWWFTVIIGPYCQTIKEFSSNINKEKYKSCSRTLLPANSKILLSLRDVAQETERNLLKLCDVHFVISYDFL